jgi:y4mF family transcriptional regulator
MDLKDIGKSIKSRRKSLKVVQGDLAEIAGISSRTLRDIERGTANPSLETLLKIVTVLGMEIKIEIMKMGVTK